MTRYTLVDNAPHEALILGVDPGYDRCGFALLGRSRNGTERLIVSDCYTTDPKRLFEERLYAVGKEFFRLMNEYRPDVIALEKVFFTSNQKTAMRVAEVRGALLYLAEEAGIAVSEYGPNEVKVAIAGDGRSDKRQIMLMIPRLIHISKDIRYDDEYDAIALALTASASYNSIGREKRR